MAETQSARNRVPVEWRGCRYCGVAFPVYRKQGGTAKQVYCSANCKNRYNRGTVLEALCPCGMPFTKQHAGQRYCSRSCGAAARYRKEARRKYKQGLRWRHAVPQARPGPDGGEDAICANGHKLNELDFATDMLGRVHQQCRRCGGTR